MSNTNIKHQYQYNVNDAWPKVEPTNVEDFLKEFIKSTYSRKEIGCHGAHRGWDCIQSSLDIRFRDNNIPVEQRMAKETSLLESFAKDADPLFSPEARRFIEVARLRWGKSRNTGTVFFGRHYGLPTRCVDWTFEPLIALFFACRQDFEEPGVVWWLNNVQFSSALSLQWFTAYGKNENIEDDFERDFIDGNKEEILIRFYYPAPLERPMKQKAWITLSDQYDVRHDEAIHRLGVKDCGRFIVSPQMKSDLLNKLNRWGINGATLGIDDGDLCLETIATDIANKHGLAPPIT